MSITALMAISPIDGRYKNGVQTLESYFSEYALIKYRLRVEVEYFLSLCEAGIPQLEKFPLEKSEQLRDIFKNLDPEKALRVKEIEKVTNHDVKAIEYFLKEQFAA